MNTTNRSHASRRSRPIATLVAGIALVAAASMSGCNNAGEGAVSGAGIGALSGFGLGALSGHAGVGAAAGAIIGGVGGLIIGDQNSRR